MPFHASNWVIGTHRRKRRRPTRACGLSLCSPPCGGSSSSGELEAPHSDDDDLVIGTADSKPVAERNLRRALEEAKTAATIDAIGEALTEIADERLYRQATFEDYCRERWHDRPEVVEAGQRAVSDELEEAAADPSPDRLSHLEAIVEHGFETFACDDARLSWHSLRHSFASISRPTSSCRRRPSHA